MYLPIIVAVLVTLFLLGLFLRWRNRKQKKQDAIRQFRAWMVRYHSTNHGFQLWKNGLSWQESEILLDLARGYFTSLNWDLDWLLTAQIEKAPELQTAVETGINGYLEAVFVSLQKEQDVQAYQAYQAFERKPTARKNRVMIEQLYDKLSQDGLLPKAKRLLGRVTRKKANLNQQAAAIQHAFEHNPGRTMALLKEVLFNEEMPGTETAQPQVELQKVEPQSPPSPPSPPALSNTALTSNVAESAA